MGCFILPVCVSSGESESWFPGYLRRQVILPSSFHDCIYHLVPQTLFFLNLHLFHTDIVNDCFLAILGEWWFVFLLLSFKKKKFKLWKKNKAADFQHAFVLEKYQTKPNQRNNQTKPNQIFPLSLCLDLEIVREKLVSVRTDLVLNRASFYGVFSYSQIEAGKD